MILSSLSLLFYLALTGIFVFLWRQIRNAKPFASTEPDSSRGDWPFACMAYMVLTGLFFSPVISSLNSSLIGPPEDNQVYYWNIWWAEKVLETTGLSLYNTDYIFYPEGTSLVYHFYSFYNLTLAVILRQWFGRITVYNLLILHSFVLAGTGAYLLIRYLVKHRYLAFLGGYIYAFNPSHYAHALHHVNISSIQFIPFFILFYIRALRHGSKRDIFLCILFFFLNTVSSWYYLIYGIYFMLFSYGYLALRRKRWFLPDVLFLFTTSIAVTAAILSPWLWEMILNSKGMYAGGHNRDVGDLLGLFIPHAYHPLGIIPALNDINMSYTGNPWESIVYLGLANALVAGITVKRQGASAARYICACLAFLLLSMGTELHIAGKTTTVTLPAAFIQDIPFFSNARSPSRAIVFAYLFLAILVAIGFQRLLPLTQSGKLWRAVYAMLVLLVFLDFAFICKTAWEPNMPDVYRFLSELATSEKFGILNLPEGPFDSAEGRRYMMHQTFHGIPISSGMISRKGKATAVDDLPDSAHELSHFLSQRRVKYIIYHTGTATNRAHRYALEDLLKLFPVHYRARDGIAFEVY